MNPIGKIQQFIKDNPHSKVSFWISKIYTLLGHNSFKISGGGNQIITKNSYINGCKIHIIGNNNIIDFGQGASYITNSTIYIYGNDNIIKLGTRNVFVNADLYIEDNSNEIIFGNNNRILGRTHIACCEGQSVSFGDGCLFSTDVIFRNTDSHAIIDCKSGERINPAKSIQIGNRCWFGNKTTILKGVSIGDDSIIATGAIVTHDVSNNSIAAGIPAKVVKTGIRWNIQR